MPSSSSSSSSPGIRIERLQPQDIPVVAEFVGQAFENDRHTQMKALGQEEPFDMKQYTLESMPSHLQSRVCHVLKAVDEATGEIMGVCNWGIKGFTPKKMPLFEERVAAATGTGGGDGGGGGKDEEEPKTRSEQPAKVVEVQEEEEKEEKEEKDPIKRLVALTDADLQAWMREVMPPENSTTRCLFIIGLTVAPRFQGRGAGSALLRWGTRLCDDNDAFAWVHSSDSPAAWTLYRSAGFHLVRSLDIDLDAYAPCPPPAEEGPHARWGHYVFRYMKYFPRKRGGGLKHGEYNSCE